jgi:rhodanese-related sulfurtransferase
MQDIFLFAQHHLALSITLLIILVLLMLLELIKLKQGAKSITPALATHLINHQNAVIVDIRHPDAFAAGHIVNAISVPYTELEPKHSKLNKFKTQPIVIACASGIESPRAASFLTKKGFNNIFVLTGGIRGWKEADMPLVRNKP